METFCGRSVVKAFPGHGKFRGDVYSHTPTHVAIAYDDGDEEVLPLAEFERQVAAGQVVWGLPAASPKQSKRKRGAGGRATAGGGGAAAKKKQKKKGKTTSREMFSKQLET